VKKCPYCDQRHLLVPLVMKNNGDVVDWTCQICEEQMFLEGFLWPVEVRR
jgi:hypothetical protein